MKKINIKTLAWILIILVIGLIMMQLFLPKKIDLANSRISTFDKKSKKEDTEEEVEEEEQIIAELKDATV